MLMDSNTLSMEQGKEFVKQLGIPQRDVSKRDVGQMTRERNEVDSKPSVSTEAGSPPMSRGEFQ